MDEPADRTRNETVAGYWNEQHQDAAGGDHDNYLNHPMVQAYISMRAFGSLTGHLDAAAEALRTHTGPGDTILSLGCGAAGKERHLARLLPDRRFLGVDIADEVVARANAEIRRDGPANLELILGDFNDLDLQPGSLRVVLGLGAIHHVENLEGLWAQARRALVPGGLVLAQEYVGPSRFQWTAAQVECGDRALRDVVPERHKPHHQRIVRPSVAEMIAADPSEAVRSAEIVATCRDAGFAIRALTSAGGALLQPVLMNQIHTYDPRDWSHNLVLSRLFAEEDRLMREGILQDDFAMLVAAP